MVAVRVVLCGRFGFNVKGCGWEGVRVVLNVEGRGDCRWGGVVVTVD